MSESQKRILIVDDEESIRRNLQAYLEDEGFQTICAESGEKALEILSSVSVDAAIVDMRLPGMDGNIFIEHAHSLDSSLSFLVYTGSVGYQPPERLLRLGIGKENVYIKPLSDMSALTIALTTLLETRREHE